MKRALPFLFVFVFLVFATRPAQVFAQGGSSRTSLSGQVSDKTGGVIPGASVDVKNNATGVSTKTITNSTGQFNVPALDPGTYTVTVTLQGFKTAVVKEVVLIVGNPMSVPVTLEVGTIGEEITVAANSSLVQTQSTAVSSTINLTQIQNLPLTSRNALFGFVIMLPGVSTPGAPRDSTLFGLPETSINITIDGVNTNNNFQRETDGFYSMVFPQLDAVEQVTVTGAGGSAEGASMGSVAIRFATRSGTNRYTGTAYYYMRRPGLNTNDFFSDKLGIPKTQIKLNQFGASEGGPIKLPGYDGSGKAFFFVNYEEFYQPTSTPLRTRQLLNPAVQGGLFRYNVSGAVREVNVLTLAAANGQTSSIDPVMGSLLAEMRSLANDAVSNGTGTISEQGNVLLQQLDFKSPGKYVNHLPTTRVDFNLTPKHRLSGSYWWQQVNRFPDIQNTSEAQIPGLSNYGNYRSIRTVGSVVLRSTLSAQMVNEAVGGWQWSPGTFNADVTADMFDNQAGYSLSFPFGSNATNATPATRTTNPNSRYQTNLDFKDTLSWLRGNHSLSMGAGFTRVIQHNTSKNVVPTIQFGVQTALDPADAMFNTTNFPGAATVDLANARSLYAHLTGRVTSVGATAFLNEETGKYEYLGLQDSRGYQDTWNSFIQDSWKLKPTLTLNAGVAWVVQLPFAPGNSTFSTTDMASFCGPYGQKSDGYCKGLFQVGGDSTVGKQVPEFNELTKGTHGYSVDYKQFSPNIGMAWRPNVQDGILRTILGDPEQATLRFGFSIGFNQPSVGTGVYGGNPGRSISATRNNNGATYLLVGPGETWPVLFRTPERLGPPPGIDQLSPAYPILAVPGNDLNLYDPNLKTPYTRSYSFGLQRGIGRDMAVEVRYVGTQSLRNWSVENWNDSNIYETGFLDEFQKAQSNLRATVAAGLCASSATCTFGYRGPGTGTVPLPIYLGYLTGSKDVNNPAAYTATNFTNTTFIGRLNMFQPSVCCGNNTAVSDLTTTARLANGITAGFPANFWRMNPAVGTGAANMTMNAGSPSRYDSYVIELRRRLSNGLLFSGSWAQAWRYSDIQNIYLRDTPQITVRQTNEVPWALKLTGNWDVPVGRGRHFATNASAWVDGIIGGWALNVTGRVQDGALLTSTGITLVGMTEKEMQKEYYMRTDATTGIITMFPDDIIQNTRRAFTTSATSADGYGALGAPTGRYMAPSSSLDCVQIFAGDCGQRNFYVSGPLFTRFDLNAKKQFPLGGSKSFVFQLDILNLFNAVNFNPVFNPGSGATIFQVTSAYQDVSGTYDPGGRLMQLVFRINW